jgi:hypothetical protein
MYTEILIKILIIVALSLSFIFIWITGPKDDFSFVTNIFGDQKNGNYIDCPSDSSATGEISSPSVDWVTSF